MFPETIGEYSEICAGFVELLRSLPRNTLRVVSIVSCYFLERISAQIMSRRNFTVYTYDSEVEFLKSQVRRKDCIETGGDLFGLWLDDRTLVIQLITGPGQNCKRTVTSFFQDVEYLEKVGTHLTTIEGLCNVGEWHSHHRLGLPQPSHGDEETVWRSMSEGLTRFAVFIANISGPKKENPQVNVGCFLFDKLSDRIITGEFKKLKERSSPLREKPLIQELLESGAEKEDSFPSDKRGKRGKDTKRKHGRKNSQFGNFEDGKKIGREGEDEGMSKGAKRNKRQGTCGVKKGGEAVRQNEKTNVIEIESQIPQEEKKVYEQEENEKKAEVEGRHDGNEERKCSSRKQRRHKNEGGNVKHKSGSDVIVRKKEMNVGDEKDVKRVSDENCNEVGKVVVAGDKVVNSEVKTKEKSEEIESDERKNREMKIDEVGNEVTDEIAERDEAAKQNEKTDIIAIESQIPQEEEEEKRKGEVEGRQDENKERKHSPRKQGRRKKKSKQTKKNK